MNDVIERAVQGSLHHTKEWLLASASEWLHWLASWFLSTFGWGGLVAMGAGAVLLISLSARAVKFFHSPRGMATAAAAMVGGLAFMWWFRPMPAQGNPPGPDLASRQPVPKLAVAMPPKLKPATSKPLAVATAPKRPDIQASGEQFLIPAMFVNPSLLEVPALPKVAIPHVSPVIVHQKPHATPAAGKPHVTVAAPAGKVPVSPRQPAGASRSPAGQMSQQQNNQARLQAQQRAAMLAHQNQQMIINYNHMMSQYANGMHPGYGMHPGMGHAGTMGHHPGHR